ncbi:hypothetical protein R6Q59_015356 [Mikania micrantha]
MFIEAGWVGFCFKMYTFMGLDKLGWAVVKMYVFMGLNGLGWPIVKIGGVEFVLKCMFYGSKTGQKFKRLVCLVSMMLYSCSAGIKGIAKYRTC